MAARLIVEWTRTNVRLAQVRGAGRAMRVVRVLSEPLEASAEPAETVRRLLKAVRAGAADAIGIVPREQVITRVMKFPATQSGELAQMVELYARAQLPYPREQTVLDFSVLRQLEGFSTVAIVACQREVIDRHLAVLRQAGLSAAGLTVSTWGVLGWYRHVRPPRRGGQAPADAAEEPTLVVNIDAPRTDLVLIAEGRILSSRSVGQGAEDWRAAGDVVALLANEVERSRAAVRKELPGAEVRSLTVTGVGDLASWADGLARRLGLPAVAVEHPVASLGKAVPESLAGSPVVLGGVAATEPRELLSLSPLELRMATRHRRQVQELVAAAGLLLAVLGLGSGLLALRTHRQQQHAERLRRVLAQIERPAKQVQEKARLVKLVDAVLDERRRLAEVLAEIFRRTPGSVALEQLTFERPRRHVIVRGTAPATQQVLEFIESLEQVDGIRGVRLKYSTQRETLMGERTTFELVLDQAADQPALPEG